MKKLVLVLAAFIVLSSVSAWADTNGYTISSMTSAYKTVYSSDVKTGWRANIVIRTTLEKYSDGTDYAKSADKITWSVSNDSGSLIRCRLGSLDNELVQYSEDDVSSLTAGSPAQKVYRLRLTGSIPNSGTVRVTAKLEGDELTAGTTGSTEKYVDIMFTAESRDSSGTVYTSDQTGDDAPTEDISASSVAYDSDTSDPRDPDSREWDGNCHKKYRQS